MKQHLRCVLTILCLLAPQTTLADPAVKPDETAVIRLIVEGWVGKTPSKTFVRQSGTGFFVREDGYLLTAAHVLYPPRPQKWSSDDPENGPDKEGQPKSIKIIQVDKAGQPTIYGGRPVVVSVDRSLDLALIRIAGTFPYLMIGDSSVASKGDKVKAFGFEGGRTLKKFPAAHDRKLLQDGNISSSFSVANDGRIQVQLQGVEEGFSGGPIISANGRVIGIINTGKPRTGSRVFATPINYAINLLNIANVRRPEQILEDLKKALTNVDDSTIDSWIGKMEDLIKDIRNTVYWDVRLVGSISRRSLEISFKKRSPNGLTPSSVHVTVTPIVLFAGTDLPLKEFSKKITKIHPRIGSRWAAFEISGIEEDIDGAVTTGAKNLERQNKDPGQLGDVVRLQLEISAYEVVGKDEKEFQRFTYVIKY